MPELTPRQIIDPESTLPDVTLVRDPTVRVPRGTYLPNSMLIMHGGERIGEATLVERLPKAGGREAFFHGVNIDKAYRGKGFGMAAYLAAIEYAQARNETFRTEDWTQTAAAARVWDRFIDAGIAEVVEPLRLIAEGESAGKFVGHVQIPPSE